MCGFIHLYRTPSQTQDGFHNFFTKLEINLDDSFNRDPFLTNVIGDFNAKSSKLLECESTVKGSKIGFLIT